MADIVLTAGVRQNLLQLQKTSDLITATQTKLATGKRVNSALSSSRFAALMFAVTAGPTAAVMLAAMVAATSPMAMGTAIPLTSIVPMTGAV